MNVQDKELKKTEKSLAVIVEDKTASALDKRDTLFKIAENVLRRIRNLMFNASHIRLAGGIELYFRE